MSTYSYVDTILHGARLGIKMCSPDAYVEVTEKNPWVDRLLSEGKTRVLTYNVVKT